MKDKQQLIIYAALAITALLTLIPFFNVGFTTTDDFQYFITTRHPQNWIGDATIYAQDAGRFYFLITKYFYYVPYLIDNFAYTKAVQYISLIASYAMFAWLIFRLFKSKNLSLLTFLLLIFDTTITANNHVPTIAYPFYFSFSLIIFIGGILMYLNYKEKSGYWRIIVSAILFLIAFLFYETYLIFAIIFGIIITIQHWKPIGFIKMLQDNNFWREVLPYIGSAIIYVGCYVGYRQLILTHNPDKIFYDGASFSIGAFSISGFFKVLWRCTKFAFPSQSFFDSQSLLTDNSLLIGGHRKSINMVLSHAPAIVWINAIIQTAIVWYLTKIDKLRNLENKKLIAGIVVSFVVAFFAHTLIGVASKYNQDWCNWMHGYVTSYYSIFALMLALALIIIATIKICKNEKLQKTIHCIWCIAILIISVLIGYTNQHVSREWAKSQNRLKVIDLIAKTDFASSLPNNATIYIEELHNTSWVAHEISKGYEFEHYINTKFRNNFNYVIQKSELEQIPSTTPLYYLHAIETKKVGELLISFAKLDSTRSNKLDTLRATEADIFYYSPTKRYTIFYQSNGDWKKSQYWAEKQTIKLTHTHIEDTAINPRTIVISDMTIPMSE